MKTNSKFFNKNLRQKGHEIYYDDVSERMVFEIHDTEGMLPLLIKGPFRKTYELIYTQNGKLNIR